MENYVKIQFPFYHEGEKKEWKERMWARPMGQHYELSNTPIYVKEYSFGDVISVKNIDGELFVDELIQESGHSTIRIVFHDMNMRDFTVTKIGDLGCDIVVTDKPQLIAVDIPPAVDYRNSVLPLLEDGLRADQLGYEEACISTKHSG
ncbi:protein of unknown function [Chitinophaga eiseniae]|uniref:DUF4265 domain-containing protein n=1 Tax=Chitinophaga eiseniae TaxID=634771 RepID=A0A1T4SWU7_9BACT|nr:DUF4265 domain-containing protein [Chitinophaga eiseniae]SKA32730.1 protein of unknown function [Chitinophaga eiseniae]